MDRSCGLQVSLSAGTRSSTRLVVAASWLNSFNIDSSSLTSPPCDLVFSSANMFLYGNIHQPTAGVLVRELSFFLRSFPFRTAQEVGIVHFLHITQAFRRFLAACNASDLAEVFEAFDSRGNDDQNLRPASALCGKCMRQMRRYDDYVSSLRADDFLAGEHPYNTFEHIEHLRRLLVTMRSCAVRTLLQRYQHGGERATRCTAVRKQFDGGSWRAHDFGFLAANHHRRVWFGEPDRHGILQGFETFEPASAVVRDHVRKAPVYCVFE